MRKRSLALSVGLGVGLGLSGTGSALALPPIGPGFEADAPVPVQEDKSVYDIGVATDGERLFTVFEEGGNIRGMLTDATGHALLSKMPYYANAPADGWNTHPSVAFGDSNYLVVYSATPGIFALRVDVDGHVLGEPVRLSETGYSPAVGWLGDKFVVAWYETDDIGREVASATVSSAGSVGETQILSIEDSAGEPSIAASSSGALISWVNRGTNDVIGVEAVLVDTQGELAVPEFALQTGGSAYDQRVAAVGDDYLVVWSADTGVRGVTVTNQGNASEPFAIGGEELPSTITMGANTEGYTVAWLGFTDEGQAWNYRHVSVTGELGGAGSIPEFEASFDLGLLGKDDGFWAVYRTNGVWGTFTDGNLSPVGTPSPLSLVANSQNPQVLFWNGQHYVLVWDDERFGDWTFSSRMIRVDTAGERLDPDSIWLDEGSPSGGFNNAAVPLADGRTLVAWAPIEPRHAYTRIVNADGTLTQTVDLGPDTESTGVSLAAYGDRRLLVYADEANTHVGQLFDDRGEPIGGPRPLPVAPGANDVRAHASADGFLLQVGSNEGTGMAALHDDWTLGELQLLQSGIFPVDVAIGGGKTAVIWSYFSGERVARFWGGDGWAGEPFTLGQDAPWGDVVWDGTQFAAAWQDEDYYGHWTTFDLDGNVAAPERLFDEECNGPKLASNGAGQVMLSCVRYDRDYSRRIVNYMVGSSPNPSDGGTASDDGSLTSADASAPDAGNSSEGEMTTGAIVPPTSTEPSLDVTDLGEASETLEIEPDQSSSDDALTASSEHASTSTNPDATGATSSGSGSTPPERGCHVAPPSRGGLGGLPFLALAGVMLARRTRRRI